MKALSVEQIAEVCHETVRAYCRTLEDFGLPAWGAATVWQKKGTVEGVKFILANPDSALDATHTRWVQAKLRDGWTYGPVKDVGNKIHPFLLPFDELPQEHQTAEFLFRAVVGAMT